MKPHKRNGREARQRRQESAEERRVQNAAARAEIYENCMECGASKLRNEDCSTPHCMALREEPSVFYDEVTDDHVQVNGARMYSGVDY